MPRSLEMQMIIDTFLDKERVLKAWDQGKIRALTRAGALVRYIARRSLRPPRRVSKAEMTPEALAAFEAAVKDAKKQGRPRPKRPLANSPSPKPPYNKTGLLKDHIYFGRNPKTDEMYVGPVAVGGLRTAWLLEHGGTANLKNSSGEWRRMRFRGNPFMWPALQEASPKIPPMFANVVKADAVALTRGSRG